MVLQRQIVSASYLCVWLVLGLLLFTSCQNNNNIDTNSVSDLDIVANAPSGLKVLGDDSNYALISWSVAEGAESYRVDVSTDQLFIAFVENYRAVETNDTSLMLNNLLKNTQYFYRVTAVYPNATTRTSDFASFRTAFGYIEITKSQPRNNASKVFWWNDRVFYEIFVRSFYDSNGDGIGDFNGITQKLDYLKDLGVGGIWLMPINPSPSYHGYDVSNYYEINEDYGTMEDFERFINEAHQRDIKVIIDLVINHASRDYPPFRVGLSDALAQERELFAFGKTKPNRRGELDPNPWHGIPTNANPSNGYYYAVFWEGMPDWNHKSQSTTDTFKKIIQYWLEEKHVDGYRVDAVRYLIEENNYNVLSDSRSTFNKFKEYRDYFKSNSTKDKSSAEPFWVGEAWTSSGKVIPYISNESFDFCFEFDLAGSILHNLRNESPLGIHSAMNYIIGNYPKFNQWATFLTNHDQNRIGSELGGNVDKLKLASQIYLSLPGIPFVYYGEEIGMKGVKPDEKIRTPMQWNSSSYAGFSNVQPWISINGDYQTINVETEQSQPNSLLNVYKKAITFRNENDILTKGDYQGLISRNNNVFTFLRHLDNKAIVVVANFKNQAYKRVQIGTSTSNLEGGNYQLRSENISNNFSVNENGGFSFYAENLQPYEFKIYHIE